MVCYSQAPLTKSYHAIIGDQDERWAVITRNYKFNLCDWSCMLTLIRDAILWVIFCLLAMAALAMAGLYAATLPLGY